MKHITLQFLKRMITILCIAFLIPSTGYTLSPPPVLRTVIFTIGSVIDFFWVNTPYIIAVAAGLVFGYSILITFLPKLKLLKKSILISLLVIISIYSIIGLSAMLHTYGERQEIHTLQQRDNKDKTKKDYYTTFKNINPIITTTQAKALFPTLDLEYNTLLDVREHSEYDIGKIPGSMHIRSSDLLAGDRERLDPHKITYVICAQSMRGKRISDFLRSKGIIARYLEHGHQHYYKHGGLREGNNGYYDYRTGGNYLTFLDQEQLTTYQQTDDILFLYASDPQENPDGLLDHKITDTAVMFPYMYMTTPEITQKFSLLQQDTTKKKVITIYHGRLELFDAVNLGIEAEKRGYEFLGSFGR